MFKFETNIQIESRVYNCKNSFILHSKKRYSFFILDPNIVDFIYKKRFLVYRRSNYRTWFIGTNLYIGLISKNDYNQGRVELGLYESLYYTSKTSLVLPEPKKEIVYERNACTRPIIFFSNNEKDMANLRLLMP